MEFIPKIYDKRAHKQKRVALATLLMGKKENLKIT